MEPYHLHGRNWYTAAPKTGPNVEPMRKMATYAIVGAERSFSPSQVSQIIPLTQLAMTDTQPPAKKRTIIKVAKLFANACAMTDKTNATYVI